MLLLRLTPWCLLANEIGWKWICFCGWVRGLSSLGKTNHKSTQKEPQKDMDTERRVCGTPALTKLLMRERERGRERERDTQRERDRERERERERRTVRDRQRETDRE